MSKGFSIGDAVKVIGSSRYAGTTGTIIAIERPRMYMVRAHEDVIMDRGHVNRLPALADSGHWDCFFLGNELRRLGPQDKRPADLAVAPPNPHCEKLGHLEKSYEEGSIRVYMCQRCGQRTQRDQHRFCKGECVMQEIQRHAYPTPQGWQVSTRAKCTQCESTRSVSETVRASLFPVGDSIIEGYQHVEHVQRVN